MSRPPDPEGVKRAPVPPVHLGMERPPLETGPLRLGNASAGGLVAREVRVLDRRRSRWRLAWGRRLEPGQALWLAPAPLVHGFGARGPWEVAFLDDGLRVLGLAELRPWRILTAPAGGFSALLRPPASPGRLRPGDQLEWILPQPRLPDRDAWLRAEGPGTASP